MARIEIDEDNLTDLPVDEKAIIENLIYERLICSYDCINQKYECNFNQVINDLKKINIAAEPMYKGIGSL